jgi:hypothetical protein
MHKLITSTIAVGAVLVAGALANPSAAQAQFGQLPTAGDRPIATYNYCISQGYGAAFCQCYTDVVFSLLTPEDIRNLDNGGRSGWIDNQANRACAHVLPPRR